MLDIRKYQVSNEGWFSSTKPTQPTIVIHHLTEEEKEELTKRGKLLRQSFYQNSNRLYKLYDDYNVAKNEIEKLTEELRSIGYFSNKTEFNSEEKDKSGKIIKNIINLTDKMSTKAKEMNGISNQILKAGNLTMETTDELRSVEKEYFEIDAEKSSKYENIFIGADLTDYPWRGLYELDTHLERSIMNLLHECDVVETGNPTDTLSSLLGL